MDRILDVTDVRLEETAAWSDQAVANMESVHVISAGSFGSEAASQTITRAQAAEIRAEGTRWVWDIQSRCQQLQRDLHDAIVSAETELDEVRTAFHRAQAHMEGVQDALSHLVSGTEETEKNHKG